MHGFAGTDVIARRSVSAQIALDEFCREVGAIVSTCPETDVPARIAEILPALVSTPGLLTEEEMTAPKDAYGRNTVFLCPNDKFSVLAMVWPAGIKTPIHDHAAWCAVGVYEGEIREEFFRAVDDDGDENLAVRTGGAVRRAGESCSLPWGAPNIHRILNTTGSRAISIHVYGGNCETQGPNLEKVYTAVT